MDSNISSGREPPSPAGSSRLEPPPPNPSLTSTFGHGIGSLHIPHSQNVNNPVVGGSNVNVYVNSGRNEAQTTNLQQEDIDDLITARADHEIYSSQLLTKKRGYPLWVPGPGMQLPIEYRRHGVNIGDVGIITSTGEFDFLFNIFTPADHPIHDGIVPQGFSPLPGELGRDVQRSMIYARNTHLASASVRKISGHLTSEPSMDYRFESTAKEAAILVMPDGATAQNLLNTWGVRFTISKKAKDWYTYARLTRGRYVKNGDIRVVVGIDKVSSWGIATSSCNTGQTASYVFKHDPAHAYEWDCTGGTGRAGPQEDEIHDLMMGYNNPGVLKNQSVFLRTINFTLSGKIWHDFPLEPHQQSGLGSGKFGRRDSASGNRHTPRGGHSSSGSGSSSSGHRSSSMQGSLHYSQVNFDPVEPGVNHPSTALHDCLHNKFPDADIVITEDTDWISVLNDDDVVFPEIGDLCARVLEAHEVHTKDARLVGRTEGMRMSTSKTSPVNLSTSVSEFAAHTYNIIEPSDDDRGGSIFHGKISGFMKEAGRYGNATAMQKITYDAGASREKSLNNSRGEVRQRRSQPESENMERVRGDITEKQHVQNLAESLDDLAALTKELQNLSPEMRRFVTSIARQSS